MRSPFWHETAKGRIYTVVTKRQKSHHFRSLLKGNHASECMHGPSFIRFRILKVTEIAIIYGKMTWSLQSRSWGCCCLLFENASGKHLEGKCTLWHLHHQGLIDPLNFSHKVRKSGMYREQRWSKLARLIKNGAFSFNAFSACQENRRKKFVILALKVKTWMLYPYVDKKSSKQ